MCRRVAMRGWTGLDLELNSGGGRVREARSGQRQAEQPAGRAAGGATVFPPTSIPFGCLLSSNPVFLLFLSLFSHGLGFGRFLICMPGCPDPNLDS